MRRCIAIGLALCLLLTGCALPGKGKQQYQATYLDVFDTVTVISAVMDREESFRQQAEEIHGLLLRYHQLFDVYNDYPGLNNLKTVNDHAGIGPVQVDGEIIRLLKDCKDYYELTDHAVNAAMGSVLRLWHEARAAGLDDLEHAVLPDAAALQKAAAHTDWAAVEMNEKAGTVYITDPELRLDVGAVAKGWSAQRAAEAAPEGFLISVGGNVCATGPRMTTVPPGWWASPTRMGVLNTCTPCTTPTAPLSPAAITSATMWWMGKSITTLSIRKPCIRKGVFAALR